MLFSNRNTVLGAAFAGALLLSQICQAQSAPFDLTGDSQPAIDGSAASQPEPYLLSRSANLQSADEKNLDRPIYGCACGCGVFEVGTASMLPRGQGGMLYLEYDYQDQNIDWGGVKPAPRSANPDVNIRTNFITLGVQYFFDRSWGVQVELPYDNRHFETASNDPAGGNAYLQWGSLGDVRIQGIYAGFFEDQSLGVSFGVKIPTGNYQHENIYGDVDRDSEIGTGCWDLLAGGFYRQQFTSNITGFAQLAIDAPVDECQGYRPGLEADGSLGAYYTGISLGSVTITPIGQVLLSERGHDSGPNAAHPIQSGYQRLLLSPGLECDFHPFSLYADIEVPVWQHFSGDQLTAPFLMKVILSYHF